MIDLHTHTTFSDGTDTPTQLINKALAAGITTIALTDHDSIVDGKKLLPLFALESL